MSVADEAADVTEGITEGDREVGGLEPPEKRDAARLGRIAERVVMSNKLYKKKK